MPIVSGLDKFKNQTISAVSQGEYLGEFEVDSFGNIQDFPTGHRSVIFGFKYTGVILSNDIEFEGGEGLTQVAKRKIDKLLVKFENSANGRVGSDYENLNPIEYDFLRNKIDDYTYNNLTVPQEIVNAQIDSSIDRRDETSTLQISEKIKLFSGDFITEFPQSVDENIQWVIVQDKPYPMNVLGVYMRGRTIIG